MSSRARQHSPSLTVWIREKRKAIGWSQSEVARMLGLRNYQQLCNVENGWAPLPNKWLRILGPIYGEKNVKKLQIRWLEEREIRLQSSRKKKRA